MGIRDTRNTVLAELQQGHTRSDIFRRLVSAAPSEAGKIAYCIASIPEENARKKYITHNGALCILLAAYAALNVISHLPVKPDEPTIFLVLTTVIPIIFAYFAFSFHGGVYRLAGIWFLIDLVETVLLVGAPDGVGALKLIALFLIVVLSFYIGRKAFPHLKVLGPAKDASGSYLL